MLTPSRRCAASPRPLPAPSPRFAAGASARRLRAPWAALALAGCASLFFSGCYTVAFRDVAIEAPNRVELRRGGGFGLPPGGSAFVAAGDSVVYQVLAGDVTGKCVTDTVQDWGFGINPVAEKKPKFADCTQHHGPLKQHTQFFTDAVPLDDHFASKHGFALEDCRFVRPGEIYRVRLVGCWSVTRDYDEALKARTSTSPRFIPPTTVNLSLAVIIEWRTSLGSFRVLTRHYDPMPITKALQKSIHEAAARLTPMEIPANGQFTASL